MLFGVINGKTEKFLRTVFALKMDKLLAIAIIASLGFTSALVWRAQAKAMDHETLISVAMSNKLSLDAIRELLRELVILKKLEDSRSELLVCVILAEDRRDQRDRCVEDAARRIKQ